MTETGLLKKDLFGEIRRTGGPAECRIVRDAATAAPWLRWLARRLLRREAQVLAALAGIDGIPELHEVTRDRLVRGYVDGEPLHRARPEDPAYFAAAARLLRQLHRAGVAHNDLAKEPNLLVRPDGKPAFIDFQLGLFAPRRGRLFRMAAYEDIRHLLKHKRTYRPDRLTRRERTILAAPSLPSRIYRRTLKPAYVFVTRRLLGWADREGAADRGARR
jgi:RIO-like serine/threonine protein kinase